MTEIRQLLGSSAFSDLDRHFAAFIQAQAGHEQPLVGLAAALVSRKRSEGHICLDLAGLVGSTFPELPPDGVNPMQLPRLKDWTKAFKSSPVVGTPGDFKPLVLDARRVLANPGSVGQPRDGDSRASAAILDTTSSTLTWHRVAYPIAATQAEIRARGLPAWLADRLAGGR